MGRAEAHRRLSAAAPDTTGGPRPARNDVENTEMSRKARDALVGLAAFSVFLVVGAVVLYFIAGRFVLEMLDGRHWQQTPCVIVSSELLCTVTA